MVLPFLSIFLTDLLSAIVAVDCKDALYR